MSNRKSNQLSCWQPSAANTRWLVAIKNLTKRPAPAREEDISRTKVFFHLKNQVVALLILYKNRYQYSVSTSSPTVEQRCTADAIEDEIYFFLHCDLFTHIHENISG